MEDFLLRGDKSFRVVHQIDWPTFSANGIINEDETFRQGLCKVQASISFQRWLIINNLRQEGCTFLSASRCILPCHLHLPDSLKKDSCKGTTTNRVDDYCLNTDEWFLEQIYNSASSTLFNIHMHKYYFYHNKSCTFVIDKNTWCYCFRHRVCYQFSVILFIHNFLKYLSTRTILSQTKLETHILMTS